MGNSRLRLYLTCLIDDSWPAFAGAAASPDKLVFISFFLMLAVRVPPYAAGFTQAETLIEPDQFCETSDGVPLKQNAPCQKH